MGREFLSRLAGAGGIIGIIALVAACQHATQPSPAGARTQAAELANGGVATLSGKSRPVGVSNTGEILLNYEPSAEEADRWALRFPAVIPVIYDIAKGTVERLAVRDLDPNFLWRIEAIGMSADARHVVFRAWPETGSMNGMRAALIRMDRSTHHSELIKLTWRGQPLILDWIVAKVSADGRYVAALSEDGYSDLPGRSCRALFRVDLESRTAERIDPTPDCPADPDGIRHEYQAEPLISTDGQRILYVASDRLAGPGAPIEFLRAWSEATGIQDVTPTGTSDGWYPGRWSIESLAATATLSEIAFRTRQVPRTPNGKVICWEGDVRRRAVTDSTAGSNLRQNVSGGATATCSPVFLNEALGLAFLRVGDANASREDLVAARMHPFGAGATVLGYRISRFVEVSLDGRYVIWADDDLRLRWMQTCSVISCS